MFIDAAVDFIQNISGQGLPDTGSGVNQITSNGLRVDVGLMRPFMVPGRGPCVQLDTNETEHRKGPDGSYIVNKDGERKSYVKREIYTVNELQAKGIQSPVFNAATTLSKDEWIRLDAAVIKIARERLTAWADLKASNSLSGFDAMGTKILEHETLSDAGEAIVDMDGISEGRADRHTFQLEGLPLPITHSSFFYSLRDLASSKRSGRPLTTISAESSSRKVAEAVEKTTIGVQTGLTFGVAADYGRAPTVFGYTNFPDRSTLTTMAAPTGANGTTILTNWLALRDLMYDANQFGPYRVYVSSDYDEFLDNLFSTTEPSAGTLRTRLLEVAQFKSIQRLDFLTNTFTVLMIQDSGELAPKAINGMDMTTIQWPSRGGMQLNFKVMAIQAPQLVADNAGNSAIGHGTTA